MKKEKRMDTLILTPNGRLDASTADNFKEMFSNALQKGEKKVLMDLSETDYVSSIGLRVFLGIAQQLHKNNEKIAFVCPKESIIQVFKSAGFGMLFPLYTTLEEATKEFIEKS